jgi:hypothetical protein
MKFEFQERSEFNYWWDMHALDDSCKGPGKGRRGQRGSHSRKEEVVQSEKYDVKKLGV